MLLVDALLDSIELTGCHTNLFILAAGHEIMHDAIRMVIKY